MTVTPGEVGPVRASLVVTGTWTWQATPITVVTTVEVRAGEGFVRVTTEFDNRVTDHRVRAEFPLPRPASSSRAECAFGIVERGVEAEGGPTEPALATFPSRRFVQAGGLTIAHEGLLEYELVDRSSDGDARALAVTLVRATGMLSRPPMATRPLPAGPFVPAPSAQMQGPVTVRYAVAIGDDVDPYVLAEDAFVPLLTTAVSDEEHGTLPATSSTLDVRGAQVSAVRRTSAGGPVELRVFNPGARASTVVISGHRGWLVDLRGRPLGPFEETFRLGPFAIATARLDF